MKFLHIIVLLLAFGIFGCSGNPVTPEQIAPETARGTGGQSNHRLLGYTEFSIDALTGEVELIPARLSEFHLNVTGILNNTMGIGVAGVPGEHDPPNGIFTFDITLTHPLSAPQFCGFDVRGILITPGTLSVGALLFADPAKGETRLMNADGYTRWWNPSEFTEPGLFGYTQGNLTGTSSDLLTATVNPYKYFADILPEESNLSLVQNTPITDPQGRGIFTAGESNTRRYRIRFPLNPGPVIRFGYAVDASWVAPDVNPPTDIPNDFPISANQPEAFNIVAVPTLNTLYFDSESGVGGGILRMAINVHDWQGLESGDIANEIEIVRTFSPDLFSGGMTAEFVDEHPTKARYSIDIGQAAVPASNDTVALAIRAGSNDGPTYDQGFGAAPDGNVSAWTVLDLEIPDPVCEIDTNNDFPEAEDLPMGDGVAGKVCDPDDQSDYYKFTEDPGTRASGLIKLFMEAESSQLELWNDNSSPELIDSIDVSGGSASLNLEDYFLTPGIYYVRVVTQNGTQVGVYYLDAQDMELIDLAALNPVEVTPDGLYYSPNFVWLHDNYAISSGCWGVWVHDVSDWSNPVLVSELHMGNRTSVSRAGFYYPLIAMKYETPAKDGAAIIDMTDPENPVLDTDLFIEADVANIAVCSQYIAVLIETLPNEFQIKLYSYTTNPISLNHESTIMAPMSSKVLTFLGPEGSETHLVSGSTTTLDSWDITDPTAPVSTGSITTGRDCVDVSYHDGYIASLSRDITDFYAALYTQDTSDILLAGEKLLSKNFGFEIVGSGDYLYVAGGNNGLGIINATDPMAMAEESWIEEARYFNGVAMDGVNGIIVSPEIGFMTFDATTTAPPAILFNETKFTVEVDTPAFAGDYLFIADISEGGGEPIYTIDISDPENAFIAAEFLFDKRPTDMVVYDNYLLISTFSTFIYSFNISDPLNITLADSHDLGEVSRSMDLLDNNLYLSGDSNQYAIVDVTNPEVLIEVVKTPIANTYREIEVTDEALYGQSNSQLVDFYDMANPLAPVLSTSYDVGPGNIASSIEKVGDYLYVAGLSDFHVLDISNPLAPVQTDTIMLNINSTYLGTDGLVAAVDESGGGVKPVFVSLWPSNDISVVYDFTDWTATYGNAEIVYYNGYMYFLTQTGLRIVDMY